jgi:hypothetical protein
MRVREEQAARVTIVKIDEAELRNLRSPQRLVHAR